MNSPNLRLVGSPPDRAPAKRFESDIYPRSEDAEAMNNAYKDYMTGGDLEEIATKYDLELRTLQLWARRGGWVAERRDVDQVLIDESSRKLAVKRAREVEKLVDRTLTTNQQISERVHETLVTADMLKPSDLKMLSEANRNAADSSMRAVGIAESGVTSDSDGGADSGGKKPLIVVFQGGGIPPVITPESLS